MRKIPTIFMRDWDNDPKYVTAEPNPECKWVFDGEGKATRKYDGTCVMYDGSEWWTRCQVKAGKLPPVGFRPIDIDAETGTKVGWEPMWHSGFAKFHKYALRTADELLDAGNSWRPGTYELLGPGVSGRDEDEFYFHLQPHDKALVIDIEMFDYDSVRSVIRAFHSLYGYEGIVWHHPDGRMAKIKARDFRHD